MSIGLQSNIMELIKRMKVVKNIGKIKKSEAKDIESKEREETILQKMCEIAPELNQKFLTDLFNLIFSESKRIQSEL